jgi:hypothetical protein
VLVGVRWDRWFAQSNPREQALEINKRLWSSDAKIRVRTSRAVPSTNGTKGTVRALVTPTFTPLPDSVVLGLLRDVLEPIEPDLTVLRSSVTCMSTTYVIGVGKPFQPGDDHEVGDVWGGLTVHNSGVGFSAASIVASFVRLICTNGMRAPIPAAVLLRRVHRKFDLQKLRSLLFERLQELPGNLGRAAQVLVDSRNHRVSDVKVAFVEFLRHARLPLRLLPDLERSHEAEPAIRGTMFGVSQAVTRAAQSMSPEERFALESAAGEYLSHIPPKVN